MKSIFLILTLSIFLFSKGSIELPEKIKHQLCAKLARNDSITNMCEYGSTLEFSSSFITNQDEILLFLYLEEHTLETSTSPSSKVALLIDKRGNWSILDMLIPEEIRNIESGPYNGIWINTQWVIEGLTSTLYYVDVVGNIDKIVLPTSKATNGYFESLKNICFDIDNIVLKFDSYENYPAESWMTTYEDATSSNPKWKRVSNSYDKCMSNIKPNNWKIIENQNSIEFVHSKTHQVIRVLNSERSKEIFYIQIGAFKNKKYAKMVEDDLSSFPYYVHFKNFKVKKGEYRKLVIGAFTSLDKAEVVKRLLPKRYKDSFIVKEISKY